jgi:hypothetical protein
MSKTFTHFLRIGIHSEADVFRKARPLYDALILNGNLVEATPSASAALVWALEKPFLIDPVTHAFSLSPKYIMSKSKGKAGQIRPKRSFSGLADRYFADSSFLGQRFLKPVDVNVSDATSRVLDFQNNVLTDAIKDVKEAFPKPEVFRPTWLIAPYFPLRRSLEWLDVNLACLSSAAGISANSCAIIPIELETLKKDDAWKGIADRYCEIHPKALFLWIESFDEDQADEDDLATYCKFVQRIAKTGVAPINLFGGFFSCLAQCLGLAGFAHGLVYGENKSFVPVVGGGQPPPRYYLKPAHVSTNVLVAELMLTGITPQEYLERNCDCTICRELFTGQSDIRNFAHFSDKNDQGKFIPRSYALCRYHFLFARDEEITRMESLSPTQRLEALKSDVEFIEAIGAHEFAEHLRKWISVIEPFCPT